MVRRLTHEEFIERFYIKNKNADNIEILGEYINNRTKIKCKCKIDGYEWEATPNNLLNGTGCHKCKSNKEKKTHEEFINELKKVNNDIEVLGEYINNKIKIKCKCKLDGYEWEATPNSLLNGQGCPKCKSNKMQLTHEEFINRIKEINSDIEILGEYKGSKIKIKVKCKKDGHKWEVTPNSLLHGYGCPKCYGRNKTTEDFINELREINNDIEVLGEYVSSNTKIKCKCKLDGYEWEATPNSLLSGSGCPKCNASKGEKRIAKYLDSRNIEYKSQYKFNNCKSKHKLPFDFYIPNLNVAIEYDGRQHYEIIDYFDGLDGFIDVKIRDTIKTIYCKENNIKLIRIAYWDFNNIEKILEKEL